MSNCVWACGTLGIKAPKLFRLLDEHAEWLMENGNSQCIANCVWACGTLRIEAPTLFKLLDHRADWLMENGNSQCVSNCAWACGALGIEAPKLFQLLDHRAEWLMENGSPQCIANCAWALAVLGIHAPGFFSALDRCLNKFLADADFHQLCNVCYAITVLDHRYLNQGDLLHMLWSSLLDRKLDDLPDEALAQILYIQTFSSAYGIDLSSPPSDLQSKLVQYTFTTESSKFETNVSDTLLDMGFTHQREFSPLESIPGLLSIDIACPDRMVAVECDGPSHYLSIIGDGTRREKGPTKAKRRLLQHLGWNVINLNWAESQEHKMSKEWLVGKLSEGGVEL
ncbi:RAP domain [Fragilaria crotonensis]|nr:RAP domain [Fragilaria crotonensis]